MTEMFRVLFVSDHFEPSIGGGSTYNAELTRRIAERGHTVHIVTPRSRDSPRTEAREGVSITRLGSEDIMGRAAFATLSTAFVMRILHSYDIVHGETFVAAVPSGIAGRVCNRPSMLTVYEVFAEQWRDYLPDRKVLARLYRLGERTTLRLDHDRYVAISDYTARRLEQQGVDRKLITMVHPGVDYNFWNRSAANPEKFRELNALGEGPVYSSFGRAGISKGFGYLLEAARLVFAQKPDSRLFLVLNEGDQFHALERMIFDSKDLRKHVVLKSRLPRTELRDAIAGSDLVAVPSLSEGFGFVVAETCAMGTPIVATNVGAIPEVVSGRHTLVSPADPVALATAILGGLDGQLHQTPIRKFSWAETTDQYERLFRHVTMQATTDIGRHESWRI